MSLLKASSFFACQFGTISITQLGVRLRTARGADTCCTFAVTKWPRNGEMQRERASWRRVSWLNWVGGRGEAKHISKPNCKTNTRGWVKCRVRRDIDTYSRKSRFFLVVSFAFYHRDILSELMFSVIDTVRPVEFIQVSLVRVEILSRKHRDLEILPTLRANFIATWKIDA